MSGLVLMTATARRQELGRPTRRNWRTSGVSGAVSSRGLDRFRHQVDRLGRGNDGARKVQFNARLQLALVIFRHNLNSEPVHHGKVGA